VAHPPTPPYPQQPYLQCVLGSLLCLLPVLDSLSLRSLLSPSAHHRPPSPRVLTVPLPLQTQASY
jgi:hypothetical protein